MRTIFIILTLSVFSTLTFAQQNKDIQSEVDKTVLELNSITGFKIVKLENTDFLDIAFINQESIGYGFLFGYFIDGELYKIREVIGIKLVGELAITEYYFDDSELFFVFESEKSGKDLFVSADGTVDYRIDEPNFSVKYYFNDSKLINKFEEGERQTILLPDEKFFDSQSKEGQLIDSAQRYYDLFVVKN